MSVSRPTIKISRIDKKESLDNIEDNVFSFNRNKYTQSYLLFEKLRNTTKNEENSISERKISRIVSNKPCASKKRRLTFEENLENIDIDENLSSKKLFENKNTENKYFWTKKILKFNKNIKRIDKFYNNLSLSREIRFTNFENSLFESIISARKKIESPKIIYELREGINTIVEKIKNKYFYCKIYKTKAVAVKIICKIFTGLFTAFIGENERPTKENHLLRFITNSFEIRFEDIFDIPIVYISFFAVYDLKMNVNIVYLYKENKEEKQKIINYDVNYYDIEKQKNNYLKRNIIKDNINLSQNFKKINDIKINENINNLGKKMNLTMYNKEKVSISKVYERIISSLKKKTYNYEKNSILSEKFMIDLFRCFQKKWIHIVKILSISQIILQNYKIKKHIYDDGQKIIKIQRFYKTHLIKKIKSNSKKRIIICSASTLKLISKTLKKTNKIKAQVLITNFMRNYKEVLNIFAHFFIIVVKIIKVQNRIKIHRKNEIARKNQLYDHFERFGISLIKTQKDIYHQFNKISLNSKKQILNTFYDSKSKEFLEKMAKFFDTHSKKPKKKSLIIRFIAENEPKSLSEEEKLNENSSFVRANLSNRQAMELTYRQGKNKKKSVEPNLVHKFKLDIEKKPVFIFLPTEKEKYELLKLMETFDQNKKN